MVSGYSEGKITAPNSEQVTIDTTEGEEDLLKLNYNVYMKGGKLIFVKSERIQYEDDKKALKAKLESDTITLRDVAQLLINT